MWGLCLSLHRVCRTLRVAGVVCPGFCGLGPCQSSGSGVGLPTKKVLVSYARSHCQEAVGVKSVCEETGRERQTETETERERERMGRKIMPTRLT